MKTKIIINAILIIMPVLSITCCKEADDEPDPNFVVVDFKPDSVLAKDDTMYIDINQDGKYDFRAFQHKYSSSTILIFESVDTSCLLSWGNKNPPYSYPSWKLIFKDDLINNFLTWKNYVPWTIGTADTLNGRIYLGIRLKDKDKNYYYGWLLPKIKGIDFSLLVYIDKYVFCKLKNYEIKAGQERIK